jgi:hypothetical protein
MVGRDLVVHHGTLETRVGAMSTQYRKQGYNPLRPALVAFSQLDGA